MNYLKILGFVATYLCLCGATPVLAADSLPIAKVDAHQHEKSASALNRAKKCLSDLRAFGIQMEKDGYWFGGSGAGVGYPIGGFVASYSYPTNDNRVSSQSARRGFEIRTLLEAANILARQGQQRFCEQTLANTRDVYKTYLSDLRGQQVPQTDATGSHRQQLATVQAVTLANRAFRADELIGTEVRNPQNEVLGAVTDLVVAPQTGAIAYLIIAQGGFFGFDEQYVPVPWAIFKVTPNGNLLVLSATKGNMDTAPQVGKDQFSAGGSFEQESQKVDKYWKDDMAETSQPAKP